MGLAARRWDQTSAAPPAATTRTIAEVQLQPNVRPSTSNKVRVPSVSTINVCPMRSSLPADGSRDSGRYRNDIASATRTTGALSQKMYRQPRVSVSTPPTIGPSAALDAAATAHAAVALARPAASGNAAAAMANPCGNISAAPTPCAARAASSAPRLGANAHASDAMKKAKKPARNTRLRPKRSPSEPAVNSTAANVTL